MQIAIVLFDRFTALDVVGPYEVLSRIPAAQTALVAQQPGAVVNDLGTLELTAHAALADVPRPDIIVVPGGPGQNAHMTDGPMHRWLVAADAHSTWTTSVCTGSLILAAAGLLTGRHATTHWLATDMLAAFGTTVSTDRVVVDGKYITAAGVSAGLDMALTLAARVAGEPVAQAIQLGLEYDPQPPHQAGSPAKAPPDIVDALRANRQSILQ
jgi:transcriptional regulator GlxA family with amidase domain